MSDMEFKVFHIFAGIGGGALGFQNAEARWNGLLGTYRTLGGVDVDEGACQDFERFVGAPATRLDLFSRDDYTAFHGHEPPTDWHEATAGDLRAAARYERPDVVFTSPPCKGISALLPTAQAESPKYRALNRLTIRGIRLTLEAWADDLPGFLILENVPRITSSRGAHLLADIQAVLTEFGYRWDGDTHNMGEVGGLAQNRTRYLLVARQPGRVPPVLFKPPTKRVRAIGEELSRLPMPDDEAAGPMHRLPRLQWLTWVRLALIPAGGDWRDLQGASGGSFRIEPTGCDKFNHVMRVTPWDGAAGAVTGGSGPSQGAIAVADVRLGHEPGRGTFRVVRWTDPATTVTGSAVSPRASNGTAAVADPRVPKHGRNFKGSPGLMGVLRFDQPASAVTGSASVSGSNMPAAVADPRLTDAPGRHEAKMRVEDWSAPSHTVTGSDRVGSGAPSVADPRWHDGAYGVRPWDEPAATVTSGGGPSTGRHSVADPRLGCTPRSGAYRVGAWDEPAGTVTAAGDVHAQGAAAVADPRVPGDNESGAWVIVAEDGTWHRPLTTLELLALQGFPTAWADGSPVVLAGKSQAKWRERIGNAVPPPAAEAVGKAMLLSLMPARAGEVWVWNVYQTAVWVRAAREALRRAARRAIRASRGEQPYA